ncbi:MAG TPA: hypothetical protein VHN79_02290 [Lacunisphaera sp.]|nr:hypothetical protein [Lacunisphaera sp.]
MQTYRLDSRTSRITRFLLLAGWGLLIAGCATSSDSGLGILPAKVATLEAQAPRSAATPESNEVACRIQLIDGAMVASSDRLKPGHHRLVVALGATEGEYAGDVDLVIPAAKDYRLRAEHEDETFTVSLMEADSGRIVATSSAPEAPLMNFKVFVMQK